MPRIEFFPPPARLTEARQLFLFFSLRRLQIPEIYYHLLFFHLSIARPTILFPTLDRVRSACRAAPRVRPPAGASTPAFEQPRVRKFSRLGNSCHCMRVFRTRRAGAENSGKGGNPLGNDQFAAPLFFKGHGMIERSDGALGLIVGRRLGSDPLQPEAGRGHEGEKRSAMLGGEADDFIG